MKLVNIKLLALLVISYSIALVAMTPLSWLLPLADPNLEALGVRLTNVEGSLWKGNGVVNEKNIGQLGLEWDVQLASLLLLKAPIDVRVHNENLDLKGEVAAGVFGLSVNELSGHIDEKAFESIYKSYRADLSGRLQLEDVSANVKWNRTLGAASGNLTWSGGPISIPVGRSTQNYEVPTMFGLIESDEKQWQVLVKSTSEQEYINASVDREGMATLSIKRVLATDMNIPIPGSGSSLFDISQQVF